MPKGKAGRNDPCPCGSGKKYKKCCLEKDEAARQQVPPQPSPPARAASARTPPASEPPPREPTPEERWWDDLIGLANAVKNADDALAIARRALAEAPPLPDSDWLLEAFEPLTDALARAGQHAERMSLLEAIEARFSDEAAKELPYFAEWRFESALERSDVDLVAEARRFGPYVHKVIDLVSDLPARLAWEGRVPALRALMGSAWPAIQAGDLVEWAIEAWAVYGLSAVLLDHLDRDPAITADAPSLLADVAVYETPNEQPGSAQAFVRRWLALLEPKGELLVEVSSIERLGQQEDGAALEQLNHLSAAVASRLRREKGWSRSQACVLLWEMAPQIFDCAERAGRKKRMSRSPAAVALPPAEVFVEALISRNTGMFSRKLHVVAAVAFALPAWAGEVAARGWASADETGQWLRACVDAIGAAFEEVPASRRGALERQVIDFAGGEGREVVR